MKMLTILRTRPRLFGAFATGLLVGILLPTEWPLSLRATLGWGASNLLFLGLCAQLFVTSSHQSMKDRAKAQDEGRSIVLLITSLATVASLGAVAMLMAGLKQQSGENQALNMALVAVTILSTWGFMHTMYAIHYAHEWYTSQGKRLRKGLAFPGSNNIYQPDYFDFLYFSFILGTAAQTADVSITSPQLRRVITAHCVLAFLFNTIILALSINLAASLLS